MTTSVCDNLITIFNEQTYHKITRENLDKLDPHKIIVANKEEIFDRKNESPDIGGKESFIIKCENDSKIKIFISFCIFFKMLNTLYYAETNERLMVGLDFEFNEKKIALIQLAFFRHEHNTIFIVDPNKLSTDMTNILVDTVFISDIRRIVHGSDSLDIPYIFEELFMMDSDKILKFTKTITDTRYLCEYYKIINESGNKKCSIYDAMLFFKTIDATVYHTLTNINQVMGPVQDVNWDMDKLDTYHLRYATYDVYFLQFFVANMIDMYNKHTEHENRGDSIQLIPAITRLVYLEKYDITKISSLSKLITDPMNNYYILTKNGNKTLVKIYNAYIKNAFIESLHVKISDILSINYFKSVLTYIFKRIVFYSINRKFKVFINKNNKYTTRMTIDDIYNELNLLGSSRLKNLFNEFKNYVDSNINVIFDA